MINGKSNISSFNLSGKNGEKNCNYIPNKIRLLKTKILNDYLIPLYSKQWTILKENMFFIHNVQQKINDFYKNYKLNELAVYIDLLKVMSTFMDNYNLINFQEDKKLSINDYFNQTDENKVLKISYSTQNDIMSMVYNTTMIKLLPEYEIYNCILGKPTRELRQIYDQKIIEQIKRMLTQKDITFQKIKEHILYM